MVLEKITSCFFYEELSHVYMLCVAEGHEFVKFMRKILLKKKNLVLDESSSCDLHYIGCDFSSFS